MVRVEPRISSVRIERSASCATTQVKVYGENFTGAASNGATAEGDEEVSSAIKTYLISLKEINLDPTPIDKKKACMTARLALTDGCAVSAMYTPKKLSDHFDCNTSDCDGQAATLNRAYLMRPQRDIIFAATS